MTTTVSDTTMNVLYTILLGTSGSDSSCTSFAVPSEDSQNLMKTVTNTAGETTTYYGLNTCGSTVWLSNINKSGSLNGGQVDSSNELQNANHLVSINNGGVYGNDYIWTTPYIGEVFPDTMVPSYPPIGTFTVPLDLDNLPEGVHDIKGGKVIIKKIKVDDKELKEALERELGHEPEPEEMAKLKDELEGLAASEEREV